MAKGHTHLKKLRSEKSKVKLKGKLLPKGQNVTDTSFKIKQIVIREQLKSPNNQALLSKRKLNIKELLIRLQHYNTTVKTDAIGDLKDLVIHYPNEILIPNLCQLIQGVSHLVLDREKSVRRDALKLISLMLAQVTVAQITPFFAILGSYFRCAMTHIDTTIQEDSLFLLDGLLAYVPALVAQNSSKILDNFFDLISRLRNDSQPGRTLTVNLNSKITTVKWRIKVLNRLYQLLIAIIDEKIQNGNERLIVLKPHKYSSNIPVYHEDYVQPCLLKLNSTLAGFHSNVTASESNLIKYFDQFVPLLFETWLEVGPGSNKAETSIVVNLTEEATSVLNCIVNIFQLLHTFITLHEREQGDTEAGRQFIKKYANDFSAYIFAYYPYTQIITRKRKRSDTHKPASGIESFCVAENLIITHLFSIFNQSLSPSNKTQHTNVHKLFAYVQNLFEKWHPESETQNKQTALVFRSLLLQCDWPQYLNETKAVINTALVVYNNATTNNATRGDLFDIFCDIVHNKNLSRTPSFQQWLVTLPELLLKNAISERSVNMILLLARQRHLPLLKALKLKFKAILLNVGAIRIVGADDVFVVRSKIVGLAYYLPAKDICEGVNVCLKNEQFDDGLKRILTGVLRAKFQLRFEPKLLELFEFNN